MTAWLLHRKCPHPAPSMFHSQHHRPRCSTGCQAPSPACTLPQMPLGPESLLQRLLVMRVLELPVFALGGPADSHCPDSHSSLGSLDCSRDRKNVTGSVSEHHWRDAITEEMSESSNPKSTAHQQTHTDPLSFLICGVGVREGPPYRAGEETNSRELTSTERSRLTVA